MKKITLRDSKGRIAPGSSLRHGLSNAPIYDCWVAMKARCLNPQHPMYSLYGGRGIEVCDRWLQFDNFYTDMGDKLSPKHTLDRTDVNGNYEPANCRWITHARQQLNRRNNNTVPGVRWEHQRSKWFVTISVQGVQHFLGRFDDHVEASIARYKAEALYGI